MTESIWVACPPGEVWDYTQDFTRRTEWDAGIAEATILQQDPRRVRVKVAGLGRMTVVYQLDRRPERTSAAFVDVESAWVSGGGGSWEYEAADGGSEDKSVVSRGAALLPCHHGRSYQRYSFTDGNASTEASDARRAGASRTADEPASCSSAGTGTVRTTRRANGL